MASHATHNKLVTPANAGVHDTIAAVWRIESARIVAAVARRVRDIGVAEELAQDALVAALERWPLDGLPERPAAWLMTTALNRAIDHLRHRQMTSARHEDIAADIEACRPTSCPTSATDSTASVNRPPLATTCCG
jgi:predicted RNA polymerase sigma factor